MQKRIITRWIKTYKIDVAYSCEDLTEAYKLDKEVEVFLAYESDCRNGITRKIYVSGRRYFSIHVKPDVEAFLIIYDPKLEKNIIESLIFNKNGNVKLTDVFDKHRLVWQQTSKEHWEHARYRVTHYCNESSGLYFYKNGFYIIKSSYTDFNVFNESIEVYVDNGPKRDGSILRFFSIFGNPSAGWFKLNKDVYSFVDEALNKGFVMEEYKEFMNKQKEIYNTSEKFIEY